MLPRSARQLRVPPVVRAISFTGSTAAGEAIHRSVAFTTRTQMELGGKNPLIVMEDADLDKAVDLTVKGGLSLSGQACTGTSRVLVMKQVKAAFTEKLVTKVKALKVGSGMVAGNDIGPLATRAATRNGAALYRDRQARSDVAVRRRAPDRPRLRSAAITSRPPSSPMSRSTMRIAREEIFGPVIGIMEVTSYADAIAKANDTEYGLSAAIATRNPRYIHDFANDIESGTVKINRTTTGNLINAPFGGLKRSPVPRRSGSPGARRLNSTPRSRRSIAAADPGRSSNHHPLTIRTAEDNAMRSSLKLELEEARHMVAAAIRKSMRDRRAGDRLCCRRRRLSARA